MPSDYQLGSKTHASRPTEGAVNVGPVRHRPASTRRPAPEGCASWDDYYRAQGFPEEDLDPGEDRLSDPQGGDPDIWFQKVDDVKTVKNRLRLDIGVSGGQDVPRPEPEARVKAEAERLVGLGRDHYPRGYGAAR
jgi:hypothetical protein